MKKRIVVKITPNASKNEIVVGQNKGILLIKLKARPVEGRANEALIKFLSKEWKIPQVKFTIIRGKKARLKTIEIEI